MRDQSDPTGRFFLLPEIPTPPGHPDRFGLEAALFITLGFHKRGHFQQARIIPQPGELAQTSKTCKMSYQINGAFSLAKSVPIPNKYGFLSLRCSHRLIMISAPTLQTSLSRHFADCASALSEIRLAYGQGSSFRPGPRNLPNCYPLRTANRSPAPDSRDGWSPFGRVDHLPGQT